MRKSDRWGVSRPAATAIGLFAALLGVVWAREDARPATQGADDPRMGQLVVGQNTDGRLEIFRVAPDGELRHRWQKASNGEWSAWAGLGGSLAPGIAAAQAADGGLAIFAVDKGTRTLRYIRQKPPNRLVWGAWQNLGGSLRCPVTVGRNLDGRLEVFAVEAGSGAVKCIWQTNREDGWSAWGGLGGSLEPGLAVERNRDGCLELFGVEAGTKALVHCWQHGANAPGSWSAWDSLGGRIQPGFAVGRNTDGRLEVFALNGFTGGMDHLYQIATTNGVHWSPWTSFGGTLRGGVAVSQNADGRLEVFAAHAKHPDVMHRWQLRPNGGEAWSEWWSLWGSVEPYPAVGRNQDGNLEIFGVDSVKRSRIQHKRQISANLDWLDWFSMDQPVFPYTSRTWQTEDGLPHNVVQAIAQTPDGYLWVGTPSGLARFDGVRFTTFDGRNTPALTNSVITSLCVDRGRTLWIGTRAGLVRLKEGVFSRENGTASSAGDAVSVIYESRDGSLWVGTSSGLDRYKEGKVSHYTRKEGLLAEAIRAVFEDSQTNLWIGTAAGLNRLKGTTMEAFNRANGLPEESIRGITQDKGWRIWIGSDNGMIWYNTGQFYAYDRKYGLSDSFVSAVCEDRDGNLWVGTRSGLNRFREGRFFNELKSEGVPYDKVNTLFEDREGNLWIGSIEGLIRLTPRRFFTFNKQQGLTHNNTVSVLEDRNGSLWTGTYGGGLNCLRDEQVVAYTRTNGLSQDLILALGEGRDGSLWIGADAGGGLYQFKSGEFKHYTAQDGLIEAAIKVIHEDRAGNLWLGTSRGLSCLKGGEFTHYTVQEHLAGNEVRAICEDQGGNLWFGTEGGLSRREKGSFVNFTTREGLSDNSVTALHEDAEHNLWIGTASGGLNRLKGDRITVCTAQQGLFSDEVFELLEDDYGWLWMSCAKGIYRVRKRDLEALDQGQTKVITSIAYGKADGMAGTLCNGIAKPAGWKASDGRLWFCTTKGLVVVDPNIKVNEQPPPVFIEQLIADQQQMSESMGRWVSGGSNPAYSAAHPFIIPPGRGELEFDYTALDFQTPEQTRFKHKLEGVDSEWIDAGTRRVAHYNNIYPGQYCFRVMAGNSDGVWNEAGAALPILVQPHLWQTWWFRALAILAVLGAVSGTARYATQKRMQRKLELLQQQHAIEKERGRIAKDIHDDLGSSLTRIMMLGERVQEDIARPAELEVHAGKIVTSARATVQSLDEIVWAVNPENDTLDGLVGYLNQYANQFFQSTNVKCRLEMPARLSRLVLPAEVRHDLFLVVKEALNNVLKHAQAAEVRLRLAESATGVEIEIEDNGRGFEPGAGRAGRRGNGLENMRKRMASLGGGFRLTSAPGQGTKLEFTVSVNSPRAPR
jgi:ligand-binding sensor domain-containing protein/signal transduction histidine kinase